jgi:hypothetical protein
MKRRKGHGKHPSDAGKTVAGKNGNVSPSKISKKTGKRAIAN